MTQTTERVGVDAKAPDLRENDVARILALLKERSNVTVTGRQGAGRSTVLRHVVELLTSAGTTVVQVRGLRALRDRPLGALVVAGVTVAPAQGQLPALTSALASLESLVGARGSAVLVVDDADDLDPASAGAISAFQAHRQVPLLMTTRGTGRGCDESATLVGGSLASARIALGPLGFDQVHMLVHHLLPGGVDSNAVASIGAASGGVPGLVVAIVEHGRRSNSIVLRDGQWTVRGELWTSSLSGVVEPMLVGLTDGQLDALTLLASAGALPMRSARDLLDPNLLTDLDDAGLLQIHTTEQADLVAVFPPLVGDHLTREGSAVRKLLARERLVAAGLDPLPDDAGTSASGHAVLVQMFSQRISARLAAARKAWEEDPSPAPASRLVEAMLEARSRPYEIDAVLARTRIADEQHEDRARLATWAALYRAAVGGSRDAALAEIDAARAAGCAADAALRAGTAGVELLLGGIESARAALGALDEGAAPHPVVIGVAAEIELAAGEPGRARALLDTLPPESDEHISALRAFTALLDGRLGDAVREGMAGVRRGMAAYEPTTVLEHAYVAASALWLQGRAVELDDLVLSVLELGVIPLHRRHDEGALLALAASAALSRNKLAYGASLATQAAALRTVRGPHAWMDSAEGREGTPCTSQDDAARFLWDLANERLEAGYVSAGVVAGVRALEMNADPDRALALADVATRSGSPLLRRLADYATALVSQDVTELGNQQAALHAVGLGRMAVRTAVARSVLLIDRGHMAAAITHADDAWSTAGLRGRDLCGLFTPLDQAVNLTTREREVAVAVARGYTNNEIAARMVLSVRTVENHILAACRKVRVDNREDLGRAARTWLTCVRR